MDGTNGTPGGGEPPVKIKTHEWKKTREIIKLGVWNVRGYASKEPELDQLLNERQIKIAVLAETKKKGSGTDMTKNYITIYSGVPKTDRAAAGVMILVHKNFGDRINGYNIWHERIISVRIKLKKSYATIIGTYAPEEGREELSDEFYEHLQRTIQRVDPQDYLIIAGDLNAKVGDKKMGKTVGTYGYRGINQNGKRLIDYCVYNQLRIMNTFYKHKDQHKITWSARGSVSAIDYVITNEKTAKLCLDVRTYPGIDIGSDHYLVQANFRFIDENIKRRGGKPKQQLNIRSLDDPTTRWLYQRRLEIVSETIPQENDIEKEWRNIKDIVETAAKESLGRIRAKRPEKRIRNWNPEIQKLVEEKQTAFRKWMSSKKLEDKIEYNRRSAIAKKKSRQIQRENWDNFTTFLEQETYKLRPKTYKVIRRIDSNFNERVQLPKLELKEAEKFYQNLWSDPNEGVRTGEKKIEDDKSAITYEELEEALRKTKNAKAPGEDDLSAEIYKYASFNFKRRLLKFYNNIWKTERIPEEFRNAVVVPIFKKGDMTKPENYRGISLLNTCYKIYAKILAKKTSEFAEGKMLECQNGFRGGRSCTDASFTVKLLIEKKIEHNQELHMCFIDLEKAYDNVNRRILFETLQEYEVPKKLSRMIENLYQKTKIKVKIGEKISNYISINKGVRQGCPLSCVLFNIYMDKIIREWTKETPKGVQLAENKFLETILFADDQVILAENEDDLQRNVYKLEKVTKMFDMKISSAKTKTLAFRGKEPVRSKIVINGKIIEQVRNFKYLGVEISYDGETDIQSKLGKFLKVTGLINRTLRANKTRRETRIKVYNTLAIPMLTYGSEVWALRKTDKRRLEAAEMRFMRQTAGVTLRDKKRSTEIRNLLGVTSVVQRVKRYRKNWRTHVNRMEDHRSPKMIQHYTPTEKRPKGRPRRRILETSSSDGTAPNTPLQQTGH